MKKMLIHGEYMCILNLIALPFVITFYQRGSLIFWALLIFLDLAELMLLVDENRFIHYVMDKNLKQETQRIKIYMVAIVVFYVYIGIFQSWILLLMLLINDILSSGLCYLAHTYLFKDTNQDEEA